MTSHEDDGTFVEGAFQHLETAKHYLERRYPNLDAWIQFAGCKKIGCWHSHTGKHSVKITRVELM